MSTACRFFATSVVVLWLYYAKYLEYEDEVEYRKDLVTAGMFPSFAFFVVRACGCCLLCWTGPACAYWCRVLGMVLLLFYLVHLVALMTPCSSVISPASVVRGSQLFWTTFYTMLHTSA